MITKVPDKVVKRLTIYHSLLIEYLENDIEYISSPQIAARLNIDDSQVRKDFKILQNSGICKRGYQVSNLKDSIETTLGFSKAKDAFIEFSSQYNLDQHDENDYVNILKDKKGSDCKCRSIR
jgi:NADH/NAD ratio-sensing transcriptional regulator Rex